MMASYKALTEIVGHEQVVTDPIVLERYSCDHSFCPQKKPSCAVFPHDAEQVQKIVAWARHTKTPLVPVSSGSPHVRGDTVPSQDGAVMVDLSKMNRIIMIDRRNRVVIVEPGVTFDLLQTELAKQGLRLPMPLLPRRSKSVLASVLEREPILNPRYAWSLTEPLRCLETVLGTGDVFRTGELAGASISTTTGVDAKLLPLEKVVEKRRATQDTALYQYGPGQFNYYKLLSGAQGTMGIVTWASLRCEVLPTVRRFFLVPSERLESLIPFAYRLLRLRFYDELFFLNRSHMATLLGKDSQDIIRIRHDLPAWILVVGIAGRAILPDEKVAFLEKDISAFAEQYGVRLESSISGVTAEHVGEIVLNPSPDPYWKLRTKGGCQDIFFLSTLNRAPGFVTTMHAAAAAFGYPSSDIGIYLQPTHMGTSCHIEFALPFHPEDEQNTERMKKLFPAASERLMQQGAFFSRPYGIWAPLEFRRNSEHTAVLQKLKTLFDPQGILNPGKLCFG